MTLSTPVDAISPIGRSEAATLAAAENDRFVTLAGALDGDDWTQPTDCPAWDVRALAGHVLGAMEGFSSFSRLARMMRASKKAAGEGPFIDAMTAFQVRERATLTHQQVLDRLATAGPAQARFRRRFPAPLRRAPMNKEMTGADETWRMGYLVDVILTRDTWMHRVDVTRATGRPMVLTADHDGRIVADIVAEWARRHGQPFSLTLQGPAGGSFTARPKGDEPGEAVTLGATDFCRILSGRAPGTGLLSTEVPF